MSRGPVPPTQPDSLVLKSYVDAQIAPIQTALAGNLSAANLLDGAVPYNKLDATVDQYFKTIHEKGVSVGGVLAASTWVLIPDGSVSPTTGATVGRAPFYFDPADYPDGSRTGKLRLQASVVTNSIAPASDFTFGLYPVTAVSGAANTFAITLGTVVSGSTVLFSAPAANSKFGNSSTEISLPSAGHYVLAVVTSATTAANSLTGLRAALQYRAVN